MADQVPYREPTTPPAGHISGCGGVLIGLIVLASAIGLIVLMLHGAIDWARGK